MDIFLMDFHETKWFANMLEVRNRHNFGEFTYLDVTCTRK